jgi:hypothetical protein
MKKMNEIEWLAYRLNVLDDIDIGVFLDCHWPGEWEKFGCDKDIAFEQLTEHMTKAEFTEALDDSECWDYGD